MFKGIFHRIEIIDLLISYSFNTQLVSRPVCSVEYVWLCFPFEVRYAFKAQIKGAEKAASMLILL